MLEFTLALPTRAPAGPAKFPPAHDVPVHLGSDVSDFSPGVLHTTPAESDIQGTYQGE